ncbi:nitroreductase/quinone reductase family protein [Amycolatopsis alkalitolerans]|uniref:DUF385 domain-containing protein n=1 Tax=Amycolatopsis alkalitolerans TaxID=2547244 RepID=A0A5C4M919_9PSEU|nr:nitroreductase/quinone reductase family protein [Amycolatopsis alkalitolerans]TNC27761.1 DUF385 domain-containing protein [Amycolatopsis alkalitolerans]
MTQKTTGRFNRWLYSGGRPNQVARLMNRSSAWLFAKGLVLADRTATLEVAGRKSGRVISFPMVVTGYEGKRYLVAMLGERTNWVRNVRAGHGRAVLRHGVVEPVRLVEVEPDERAPILRRYLDLAPAARPHFPVAQGAPVAEFARIAADYPVFEVTSAA